MNIVIVESPAKAKTINKYLGASYEVLASFGHVRDLPAKNGSVDPEANFQMIWEVDPKAAGRLNDIAKALKGADRLILATDPDREGEAISWHVLEVLNKKKALKGAKVGIIGVAFKPDVQDPRNSPAAGVLAGLAERGGDVRYHDPLVPTFRDADDVDRYSVELPALLAWADVIVVVTAHRVIDWTAVYGTADLVVDTVNSSSGRDVRARQVLRLGAGWSAARA